jgi:myo-inositol 2-dehydrogenase/D-chiro-inositol 1-dehydrogenase
MIRLGFIGCGSHAFQNLYPILRYTGARIVAACDLWEERRERIARAYNVPALYEDFQPMLEREALDAVIACGPADLHRDAAMAAVAHGLPILIEKPPAPSLSAAESLARASADSGVPIMVAFMKRFAARYVQARDLIHAGPSSGLTHAFVRYTWASESAPGPDGLRATMAAIGIHAIDLMAFLGGDYTVEHAAVNGSPEHPTVVLSVRYTTGATGTCLMSGAAAAVTEHVELYSDGQTAVVENLSVLRHSVRGADVWAPPVEHVYAPNFPLQTKDNDNYVLQGYAGEVAEFIRSVSEKRPPAHATIADAVRAMRTIEEIVARAYPQEA